MNSRPSPRRRPQRPDKKPDAVPKGVGYRLLCELRQRRISVRVEDRKVNGQWVDSLVATPGDLLTDKDRTLLKEHSREIRSVLPFMFTSEEIAQLDAKWAEKMRRWDIEAAYQRVVTERKLLRIQAFLGRATPEQMQRLEQLNHIEPPNLPPETCDGCGQHFDEVPELDVRSPEFAAAVAKVFGPIDQEN